jgi:hypothetical protein
MTNISGEKLNRITLSILAPLLMVTGIAGYVIPPQYNLLSGAAPYNLFHILFGAIGLLLLNIKGDLLISYFNLGFGVLDLYQFVASVFGLTPIQYFLWMPTDDVLHLVLGIALVLIGFKGIRSRNGETR